MEKAQENWIESINKAAIDRSVFEKKLLARDQKLTALRKTVAEQKDKMLSNMKISVYNDESAVQTTEKGETVKKGKLSSKDKKHQQQVLDYGNRDQTNEFDWAEQYDGWNLMTDEDLEKHAEAENMILDLVSDLENAFIEIESPPGSGKLVKEPLFDKQDLQDEFYTPMVREGLMAETFVPDEFSRTSKMIKGAFDEYKDRLEEEGFSKMSVFGECAKFGLTLTSSAASFAGSVMTFKDAANLKPEDVQWSKFAVFKSGSEDTDWIKKLKGKDAKELIDVISKGIDSFKDIGVEGSDTLIDKLKEKYADSSEPMDETDQRRMMASRISDSLITAVSAAFSESLNKWDVGVVAGSVYRSGVSSKSINSILQKEGALEVKDGSQIISELCAGVSAVFKACPQSAGPVVQKATSTIEESLKKVNVDTLVSNLDSREYQLAMKLFVDASNIALKAVVQDPAFCEMMVSSKNDISTQLGNKMAEDFNNRMKEVEEQQKDDWERLKKNSKSKEGAALIEKKIIEVNKMRERLKWAKTFSSMGIAVASKFFAPLAIAGSAISLAENLTECVIRVRDAINFIDSQIDMFRDASAYSAPVSNFIRNAEVQAVHFEIKATCDLISMIGAIVETVGYASGPGAAIGVAVGKVMQGTASAVVALESVMYEIAKKVDAALGWAKYKEALLRPENRKLALKAMKANPTLAKYSVAWGAIIEKDVIVSDFITKTGLTVESLEDPNANVGLVVQYLEARMPEDNVVVGRESVAKAWAPAPALTVECWKAAIRRGEEKGKVFNDESQKEILDVEYAILAVMKPWAEIQKEEGRNPPEEAVKASLESLGILRAALGRYKPQRKVKNKLIAHAEMKEFLGSMEGLVDARIEWLRKRSWEKTESSEE